jgi:hypothetical protein
MLRDEIEPSDRSLHADHRLQLTRDFLLSHEPRLQLLMELKHLRGPETGADDDERPRTSGPSAAQPMTMTDRTRDEGTVTLPTSRQIRPLRWSHPESSSPDSSATHHAADAHLPTSSSSLLPVAEAFDCSFDDSPYDTTMFTVSRMRIRLIVMMARRRHRQPVLNHLLRACQLQLEWVHTRGRCRVSTVRSTDTRVGGSTADDNGNR